MKPGCKLSRREKTLEKTSHGCEHPLWWVEFLIGKFPIFNPSTTIAVHFYLSVSMRLRVPLATGVTSYGAGGLTRVRAVALTGSWARVRPSGSLFFLNSSITVGQICWYSLFSFGLYLFHLPHLTICWYIMSYWRGLVLSRDCSAEAGL